MIRQIKFELKKYIIRRVNLAALLLGSLVFVVLLLLHEQYDRAATGNFSAAMGDTYTQELKEEIQAEYESLNGELFPVQADGSMSVDEEKTREKGTYGKTRIADYGLFADALDCIETVEKRNRTVRLLAENSQVSKGNYVPEENDQLVFRIPLGCFVDNAWAGWAGCLLAVLFLAPSFSTEKRNKMLPLLCATKKGEDSLYAAKTLAGCAVAAAVYLWFVLLYLLVQHVVLRTGISTFRLPLFLVDGYELCASGMTIGDIMFCYFVSGLAVTELVALAVMAFSRGTGKSIYALVASALLLAAGTWPDLLLDGIYKNPHFDNSWYLIPVTDIYRILDVEKKWNPFSLLSLQYYFEKPRFLSWSGRQYPLYVFPFIALAFLAGALLIYLIHRRKKKKV